MDKNTIAASDIRLNSLKKNLEKHGFGCVILQDADSACQFVKEQIPEGSMVAMGGCQSAREMGIEKLLCEMNINFLDKDARNKSEEERNELRRKAFMADYYIASCNAISMEGELFNIDGRGNRIAAIEFGPRKVLLFVGENKIVRNEEEAWSRIHNYATVANCIRLNMDTPCAKLGFCVNCNCDDRSCCQYSKIVRDMSKDRVTVCLVKGSWGY